MGQPVRVVCRNDKTVPEFIAEMALHTVDVVIADGPAGPSPAIRAFSHLLGECGTTFFADEKLATKTREGFPGSLDGAPFLLPGAPSAVRRALDRWFVNEGIRPRIIAELDDSALAKDLGRQGMGIFAAPTVIEAEVLNDYGGQVVGRSEAVSQQFYAISVERKIRHPAVVAIFEAARQEIFAAKKTRARKTPAPRRKPGRSRTKKSTQSAR